MRVVVSGSTGLIGSAVVDALAAAGHQPVRLVRSTDPGDHPSVRWDPAAGEIEASGLEGCDAVIHLAGEEIAGSRWTPEQKARIRDSRTEGTTVLSEALASLDHKPAVLVSASGIGVYGDRGDEELTERSGAGPGSSFLVDVVLAWEAATAPAEAAGIRVAHARTGIVLSPDGGALAEQLPFFKLGIGGRIGDGRQWWPWISIDDEVAALLWLLDHDVSGPVNLTAPNPVTNAEFTSTLGRVLRRPTILPTPRFAVNLRLGAELAQELLYSSARVLPAALTDHGFTFTHPELEGALRHLLDRPA